MKQRYNLTQGAIKALPGPPAGRQNVIYFDATQRGLGLRISRGGKMAWIVSYTAHGRERRLTHPAPDLVPVSAARKWAGGVRSAAQEGHDPLEKKQERFGATDVRGSVEQFLALYEGRPSEKAIRRYFEADVLPAIGRLKVADVTTAHILHLVETKAAKTPTAAKHLLAYIKVWMARQETLGVITRAPKMPDPKDIRVPGKRYALKPVKRKRVLSDDEIRALWILKGPRPLTVIALQLILLTGQRPGEVCGMREAELVGNVWTIPAERRLKNERVHVIPLPPMAMRLIDEARAELERLRARRGAPKTDHIFGNKKGTHLNVASLNTALDRHRHSLRSDNHPEWGHWEPHDLRRTCRTRISMLGVPNEIGEVVIGHARESLIEVYNQNDYQAQIYDALFSLENHIIEILADDSAQG